MLYVKLVLLRQLIVLRYLSTKVPIVKLIYFIFKSFRPVMNSEVPNRILWVDLFLYSLELWLDLL